MASQQHERDKTQQCLMLGTPEANKKKHIMWWICWRLVAVLVVLFGLPVITATASHRPPTADRYSEALHKALLFFNAQKSGRLPKSNGIPWRGDSGLSDGSDAKDGLVGGYYDGGSNVKFHFPMAFSMTLLSWSVIEYGAKYKAVGQYDHVRELIKWGTDYLLLTFNSSASTIDKVYAQVGAVKIKGRTPDDRYCWNRPEDMSYPRPTLQLFSAPDLGGEIAAALAAASIVFRKDNPAYSSKLVRGAATMYKFARRANTRTLYSSGQPDVEPYYKSTSYWDEYMWSAAWMYYATGDAGYLHFATDPRLRKNARSLVGDVVDLFVFSWDSKVPGAQLLLSRLRMFGRNRGGYPYEYEQSLAAYRNDTGDNMCMYLPRFAAFNFTKGGMAMFKFDKDKGQPLQYVVANSFVAALYADYLEASNITGWYCWSKFMSASDLRAFARSQLNYILGDNPKKMSYVVGVRNKYPRRLHHRGTSTPHNGIKYSCTGGYKWRDSRYADPNLLTGAIVGGPNRNDGFTDSRNGAGGQNEPTLAGNAGLVAALVAVTGSGRGAGASALDKSTMFTAVPHKFP